MFIRERKNPSGSVSIQILSKENGRNKLIKSVGSAIERPEIDALKLKAQQFMDDLKQQPSLLCSERDEILIQGLEQLTNNNIQTIGPELIFGSIYDHIGFNQIQEELFRHLVLARLAFPLSKLKTTDYVRRFQGVNLDISAIYRFLDKLEDRLKPQVEQIAFEHTKRMGNPPIFSSIFQ